MNTTIRVTTPWEPSASIELFALPEWMTQAVCASVDPEIFFPEKGGGSGLSRQPKSVCAGCPVTRECLAFALDHAIDEGVWGGLTASERSGMSSANAKYACRYCDKRFISKVRLGGHVRKCPVRLAGAA